MICATFSTDTANCITERQFMSVCTTRLETFRWTKSSPGNSPTISLAGTRLSEQPIQRYLGLCCLESFSKKRASRVRMSLAHCRLLSKRFCRVSIRINGNKIPRGDYFCGMDAAIACEGLRKTYKNGVKAVD